MHERVVTPISVRGVEMSANGCVSISHIARYCEHARWEAFKDPDFVLVGRIAGGVVRAARYEYLEPARYPEALRVQTWLSRVGRTSFGHGHLVEREDGTVIARADIAIVNLDGGRPAPLDPALRDFVEPSPAGPAPALASRAGEPFVRRFVVRPSDLDLFRHVNQARYLDFADDTLQLAAAAGHAAGSDRPIGALSLEYQAEARGGQVLQMQMWRGGDDEGDVRELELTRVEDGAVIHRAALRIGAQVVGEPVPYGTPPDNLRR